MGSGPVFHRTVPISLSEEFPVGVKRLLRHGRSGNSSRVRDSKQGGSAFPVNPAGFGRTSRRA